MKILHLSTWPEGGAAKAAIRLSTQLNLSGTESRVLHMSTKIPSYIDAVIGKLTKSTNPIFHSYNYFGENISHDISKFKPDIIHIHWIGAGYIRPESLVKLGQPIVWTLHDLWPLCGAEHFPSSLKRFTEGYLSTNRGKLDKGLDLDRFVWQRKQDILPKLNLNFIAPSKYMFNIAKRAKSLNSHKLVYIPNGLNPNIYNLKRSTSGKKAMILFVAMNPDFDINKGYTDFIQAVELLPKNLQKTTIVKVVRGDVKNEKKLASIYSQANITVVSSKIENLPFVIMESLASGTPVVSYNVGGISDLVSHKVNGYLARPNDIKDLSEGIQFILKNLDIQRQYGINGRRRISKDFNISNIAKEHLKLYKEISNIVKL